MYSCMVPLLVLWLSLSSCSGITVKRLERRVNHLESRVHDDSMAFRSDLDTLFAIVNDTSVSGKHQPSEGNTTDHCAETQQGTMTDDYVRRFQRDIDQQMNVAKRGLMAEKAWLRKNVERVENNVTLLTQDMTDHVATMVANLADIKQPLEEKLNMLSEVVKENMQAVQASLEVMSVTVTELSEVVNTLKENVQSVENRLETVKSNAEKRIDNIVKFIISGETNIGKYTLKSHAGKVYAYSSSRTTWAKAVSECQSIGAYLVEINSLAENTFIEDAFGSFHWIGASDAAEEGKWIWNHSKEPVTTAFWRTGQPNDYKGNEDCAVKYYGNTWLDVRCNGKRAYVCEVALTDSSLLSLIYRM